MNHGFKLGLLLLTVVFSLGLGATAEAVDYASFSGTYTCLRNSTKAKATMGLSSPTFVLDGASGWLDVSSRTGVQYSGFAGRQLSTDHRITYYLNLSAGQVIVVRFDKLRSDTAYLFVSDRIAPFVCHR